MFAAPAALVARQKVLEYCLEGGEKYLLPVALTHCEHYQRIRRAPSLYIYIYESPVCIYTSLILSLYL